MNNEALASKEGGLRFTGTSFIIGVMGQLAQRQSGISYYMHDLRLHRAFAETFEHLEGLADDYGLDVRFRCNLDLHGYCSEVSQQLNYLHGTLRWRDSRGDGNGWITIPKIDESQHQIEIASLPGSPQLYDDLTRAFTRAYYELN